MAIMLKFVYIDKSTYDAVNPQHIVVWSLSSSLIMVCVVPCVLLASIIGVQQTSHTARRILQKLEADVKDRGWVGLQSDWDNTDPELQVENGAIPNFRPYRQGPRLLRRREDVPAFPPWVLGIAAFLIVVGGSAGAIALSATVPPYGLNCRTNVKLFMVSIYIVKYAMQQLVVYYGLRAVSTVGRMWFTAAMDAVSLILFVLTIISTQTGILNRPGCYQMCNSENVCGIFSASTTWEVVQSGLKDIYPGILFGFLAGQVVICVVIWFVFRKASRVYLQGDSPLPRPPVDLPRPRRRPV